MTETMLFGIGVLLSVATWYYMWRPTMLDSARDKLFDLRDETVRNYFLEKGLTLDHPLYKELRDLINNHLRHTHTLSFFKFIYMIAWAQQNQDSHKIMKEQIDSKFHTDNPELAALVQKVREQAVMIMIGYAVESSFLALSIITVSMIIMTIKYVWQYISQTLRGANNLRINTIFRFAVVLLAVINSIGVTNRVNPRATMEEYVFVRNI